MARPGVTRQEVYEAANQLLGESKNPTIEQVRQILKSGSNSTIAMHLRDWKASQKAGEVISMEEKLPLEIVNAAKELWERLKAQAGVKLDEVRVAHEVELAGTRQELEESRVQVKAGDQRNNQLMQAKAKLESENTSLEQGCEFLQKEKSSLENKIDNQRQQLVDKQERIEELHRLQQQSQANLEHFRESNREQRAIEQAQFEQQRMEMQQEIKVLKESLVLAKEKAVNAAQENKVLQQNYARLEADYNKLENKYENQAEQIADLRAAKQEHQQTSQHFEKRYNQTQNTLDAKTNELIDAQSESRVLAQQLKDAQIAIHEQQDQVKHLGQEKWLLVQEKAQLEGELSQISKYISRSTK